MSLNLTLKGLDQHSAATLSALGSNLKEQFGIELPSVESLRVSGECTLAVLAQDISSFSHLLAKAGIPLIVSSIGEEPSQFESFFVNYRKGLVRSLDSINLSDVEDLVRDLAEARKNRRTVYIFGNGGSASTASHFANDLSKDRFKVRSKLFKVVCLNDSIPWITALANDEGYENVFSGQLNNLVEPGDVVIAISSSGNSSNIIKALKLAHEGGAKTWTWVGFDGGEAKKLAQRHIYIPSKNGQYGLMEDLSLVLSHMISIYFLEQDTLELEKVRTSRI